MSLLYNKRNYVTFLFILLFTALLYSGCGNNKQPQSQGKVNADEKLISECENENEWRNVSGTTEINNQIFKSGSGSLKMITPPLKYKAAEIAKDVSLDLTNKSISVWFRTDPVQIPQEIQLTLYSGEKVSMNRISVSKKFGEIWWHKIFNKSDAKYINGFTDKDYANITKIAISFKTWDDQSKIAYLDKIQISDTLSNSGIITFRFDDGRETDYTVAKRYMDKYGFKGSSFIITSSVGNKSKLNEKQIQEMYESGWDIGSHTKSHNKLSEIPTDQLTDELAGSQKYLIEKGWTKSAKYFAAPNSDLSKDAYQMILKYYDMTGVGMNRCLEHTLGIDGGIGSEAFPPASFAEIGATDIPAKDVMKEALKKIHENQEWKVYYFHEITDPSAFQAFVDAVAESGVEVLTFSQVYEKLRAANCTEALAKE
ncbi:MAG: polysaccharide deacetylase family protein [Spirochaetes bacterium]|nr:polysaccharide deacetylase family protein [Spirochaetota bacterium]